MREPIKVLRDILVEEMDLSEGQILLENQNQQLPSAGLFIRLAYSGASKVIGTSNRAEDNDAGVREEQSLAVQHLIQVDIMSFGPEARMRKEEVLLALVSQTAERLSEENTISIARNVGNILNISQVENSGMLNRYTVDVPVFAIHRKEKQVEYFDQFETKEITNA